MRAVVRYGRRVRAFLAGLGCGFLAPSPVLVLFLRHPFLPFFSQRVCVCRRVCSESDRPPFRLPSRSLASSPRSALRTRRFPSLRHGLPVRPRSASVQEFLHSLPQSPTRNPIPKVRRRSVPSSQHLRATRVSASLGTSSRALASTGKASIAAEPQLTRAETLKKNALAICRPPGGSRRLARVFGRGVPVSEPARPQCPRPPPRQGACTDGARLCCHPRRL